MTREKDAPRLRSPIFVWLKSEYLDAENQYRLGSLVPDYEGVSWPLGVVLSRDAETGIDQRLALIDEPFDRHVKCAWQLLRKRSRLRIHAPVRRSSANFILRNIGNWRGEPETYRRLTSVVGGSRIARGSAPIKTSFATTPFCLIMQHCAEYDSLPAENGSRTPQQAEIVHTDIALFYTFETFIQECLARDAHSTGVSAEVIFADYEHLYANVHPADAIPSDPSKLKLAVTSGSAVEWGQVVGHEGRRPGTTISGLDPRAWRSVLFQLRLQTHLMVALAAACRGILEQEYSNSPLVRASTIMPAICDLAPHWLGHIVGSYDYAAACEQLLSDLAELYRAAPAAAREWSSLTAAERSVEAVRPPPLTAHEPPANIDSFRLPLYEASLDDQSILAWREKYQRIANSKPEV